MVYNGDIKFRGTSSKAYPLIITTPPQIIHPDILTEEYRIPGRNGTLYGANPYRSSAQITVEFALVADEGLTGGVSKYQTAYRQVKQWLQGTGKLIIGDAADSYYEVQKVSITTDSRVILRYGTLQATFTVYPYEFLTSGDTATGAGTVTNSGDEAYPLYKLTGSRSGTLTVNGNAMTFTSTGTLYIDTRRFIAYDGSNNNCNANISGDYARLRLKHGTNTIAVSGATLEIYPKWGYNL